MRAVSKLLIFCFVILLTTAALAQDHHIMVSVTLGSEAELQAFHSRASRLDIVPGETRLQPRVVATPEDLQFLQRLGYDYTVIYENLEQFYASRLAGAATETDSLGGYHTYHDIMMYMDSLETIDTHGIVQTRFSIGQTYEGREIWVQKISDNPDADEDEPEVFYNSLIHSREPAAMEAVLYFMRYLVTNYGTDAQVTDLVNNREFYFMPCFNPDGYEYNRQLNPNGGGQWRKNRRPIGGSEYGVDLNRNFGFAWGLDNDGSTAHPLSSNYTYRGPYEFSEPEVQVVRDFIQSRQFACGIDYHTYSNLVLYPWGTSYFDGDGLTEDNTTFQMIADSMRYWIHTVNGVYYTVGTPWQTLYNTNGGTFDWEYGDQITKPKGFFVSTEVGGTTDGFWPAQNRIFPLAAENLPANLFMARIAVLLQPEVYAASRLAHCQSEWNGDGDGVTEPGEGLSLSVTLKNLGRWTLSGLQGQLTTTDTYAIVSQGTSAWLTLDPVDTGGNQTQFQISVSGSCPALHVIPLSLHLTAAGGYDSTLTFDVTVGRSSFADDAEGGTNGWTTGGTGNLWHLSTVRSASATHSWLCGNDGSTYSSDIFCYLESPPFVLQSGDQIEFDQWYAIEDGYDVGYLEIDRGFGWTQLGNPTSGTSSGWEHVSQDMGITCDGTVAKIRFRFVSDGYEELEGWYVDNIQVGPAPEFTLGSPALSQSSGNPSTEFVYSITYTNPADQAPQSALVYIDDIAHTMTTTDFSYDDGSEFTYQTTLGGGLHHYYFVFTGNTMQVQSPVVGTYEGPLVGQEIFCDNFESDLGWTVGAAGDNATLGIWNRANPEGTYTSTMEPIQPEDDHTTAPGVNCYVTDSRAGTSSGSYDVDGGRTTLLSPVWDLSGYTSVALDMWTWYTNELGSNPAQDTFHVDISNNGGTTWTPLIQTMSSWEYWKNDRFFLEDFIALSAQVRMRFIAADYAVGSLVEAAVDDICLLNTGVLTAPSTLTIYSNSDGDSLLFRWNDTGAPQYRIYASDYAEGPFDVLIGTATTSNLTIAMPTEPLRFYSVVATDGAPTHRTSGSPPQN
ncbi:MAG: M14 family zinc carboxypeptidase [Calditrichota bacterium]